MSGRDEHDGHATLARYRRLILLGKVSLPLEQARRIVGPDCAYHLYFRHAGEEGGANGGESGARATRRAVRGRHR